MQSSSSLLSEERERQFHDIAKLEEIAGFLLIHNITARPSALGVWL